MDEPRRHPRFRFRFGLRALFAIVAVIAVWLGWNLHYVRARAELGTAITADGGSLIPMTRRFYGPNEWKLPSSWRIMGARPVGLIILPPTRTYSHDELSRIERMFPEAESIQLGNVPDEGPLLSLPSPEEWKQITDRRRKQK